MVFLDFNLPNATTWFYLSLMLAVALFFKFNRFFSLRNWDVITLYLLVPGFLFLDPEGRDPTGWGYIWLMAGSAWRGAAAVDAGAALADTLGTLFASGTTEVHLDIVARQLQMENRRK